VVRRFFHQRRKTEKGETEMERERRERKRERRESILCLHPIL
jgi:hypothetical protein